MSEAAESVKKCAAYCSISQSCRFFSYDERWKESEHRCFLLENTGSASVTECCEPDHYADQAGTIPGWTSGYPPRTKHEKDNAKVLISDQNLIANQVSSYTTTFNVSLSVSPLRGAFFVEPRLTTGPKRLGIEIIPKKVSLYESGTSETRCDAEVAACISCFRILGVFGHISKLSSYCC
jgi:hypothetical protein